MSVPFDLQPALSHGQIQLRALREDDIDALFQVSADRELWVQHPASDRYQRHVFERWFADALQQSSLVILDGQQMIGSTRYYALNEEKREVAIGYTFIARSHWGSGVNSVIKHLMLDHAFNTLDVVWFDVAAQNIRSQKAVLKLGAVLSHLGQKTVNGQACDYHFYKLTRNSWPACSV